MVEIDKRGSYEMKLWRTAIGPGYYCFSTDSQVRWTQDFRDGRLGKVETGFDKGSVNDARAQ